MNPTHPSDPRATVVHVTGNPAAAGGQAEDLPNIPGYRVVKKLGQGGMAAVYQAVQTALDRTVSIKVMEHGALADETSMQRFENEARTIARLSHPNIVAIHEIGRTDDGRLYYSMPFLPNGDLAQRNLDHDDARIVEVLRTLLSALDYAHTRGVVHRDVKQENVLFDADNRPMLADFGIAMSRHDDVRITTAGFAVGSSAYMAPEQARGDVVDARADLYSVGVLTYELLTGQLPFRSTDAFALALMHAQKEIPRLPPAKKHWQAFVDKAMAKDPAQRYANAKQMLEALERMDRRSGASLLRVRRPAGAHVSSNGRRPLAWAGAVVAAAALAGSGYALRDRLSWAAHGPSSETTASAATSGIASTASTVPALTTTPAAGAPATTATNAASASPTLANPTPALPATPPAAATSAPTTAADALALGRARDALQQGHLIAPASRNAVDLALAAWELAPSKAEAQTLVDDVLQALATQTSRAIATGDDARAVALDHKAQVLDTTTLGANAAPWKAYRVRIAKALQARMASAGKATPALARTQALASRLGVEFADTAAPMPGHVPTVTASVPTGAASHPTQPATAAPPPIDPGFVKLHGPIGVFPAAAIATTEVTVRDYALFVAATHRAAAECPDSERQAIASTVSRADDWARAGRGRGRLGWRRAQHISEPPSPTDTGHRWNVPGFAQAGDHPVVCVNWYDASDYARWLGKRDGRHYRLPSLAEWQMMIAGGLGQASASGSTAPVRSGSANGLGLYGLDGNVREWLADCGVLGCDRRKAVGRSWRARGSDEIPNGRLAKRGFDDVGFRLVQVLDAAGSTASR